MSLNIFRAGIHPHQYLLGKIRTIASVSLQKYIWPEQNYNKRHIATSNSLQKAVAHRSDLKNAKRIVIKVGSGVITREDECGLALGRLASIIEQASELQNGNYKVIIVTSGAVAYGKQKLRQEAVMSLSMRETLTALDSSTLGLPSKACAATGQSGLMSLYEAMFSQYGIRTGQILVTGPDFHSEDSRTNLRSTLNELLRLNIIPIINNNDAVTCQPDTDVDPQGMLSIKDNDSLAASLAVELGSDLLVLLSDVDGLYTSPPGTEGSRLMSAYSPAENGIIMFGKKSKVGLGGMDSKVSAASWALDHGTAVVIANGFTENTIINIVNGKNVGTIFTKAKSSATPIEHQASKARIGSRALQALDANQRADIVQNLANSLIDNQNEIIAANHKDLQVARSAGLSAPMIARLVLSPSKLASLATGLRQIAESSYNNLGRVLKHTKMAEGMILRQVTVPIGVLLVIFESRPDCLPQVAALAISSGNGLLLKGGKEARHSNEILCKLVGDALEPYIDREAISLVNKKEDIEDLLALEEYIDLVIPRGSSDLVKTIERQSKGIPVLGHSEGICHVYIDKECDPELAVKIVKDSKCDYPAACNSMETLLIHKDLIQNPVIDNILEMLKSNGVTVYAGPEYLKHLTFGPTPAKSLKTEYSALECAIETVGSVDEAITHIHKYGSSHTDCIVTDDDEAASKFLHGVDSACVFHNSSTRFADGYRMGLGAEVGISTARIHARGPVGVEGLLTTKWILEGSGDTVEEFADGGCKQFVHESLPIPKTDS